MFDIIELPKTPRIARRLIQLAKIGDLSLSPDIYTMAEIEPQYKNDVKTLPSFSDYESQTLQFIDDRFGRCILLCKDSGPGENISAKYSWAQEKLPLLIVTNQSKFDVWADIASRTWPGKQINIYGNSTSKIIKSCEANITISKYPELESEIHITQPKGIYLGELMKKTRISQAIIDYHSNTNTSRRDIDESLKHVCIEIGGVIFIVNTRQFVSHARGIQSPTINDINWQQSSLVLAVFKSLYPHATFEPYYAGCHEKLNTHLESNNISLDRSQWLPLLNICPYLAQ